MWLTCSNAVYPISVPACVHTYTVPFATTYAPALHAAACPPACTYRHVPLGPIHTPHCRAEGKIKGKQQVAALPQGQHPPYLVPFRTYGALMHHGKATVKNQDTDTSQNENLSYQPTQTPCPGRGHKENTLRSRPPPRKSIRVIPLDFCLELCCIGVWGGRGRSQPNTWLPSRVNEKPFGC